MISVLIIGHAAVDCECMHCEQHGHFVGINTAMHAQFHALQGSPDKLFYLHHSCWKITVASNCKSHQFHVIHIKLGYKPGLVIQKFIPVSYRVIPVLLQLNEF